MKRPSEKLLREMTREELLQESEWHLAESARFLRRAEELRQEALGVNEAAAEELLQHALGMDAEAEAHMHQSNLLNCLMYGRIAGQDKEKAHTA